jgi:hypothetical protein
MPPKSEAKNASKGLSKMEITGVIIKFKVKKLGAPIKTLMGIKLRAAYKAAKTPILAAFKLSIFKTISPDQPTNLHTLFSYGKQLWLSPLLNHSHKLCI